jgi:hypothetical protein
MMNWHGKWEWELRFSLKRSIHPQLKSLKIKNRIIKKEFIYFFNEIITMIFNQ